MTDLECLARVSGALAPGNRSYRELRRNGHLLLAIPENSGEAGRTLALYQPQRGTARAVVALLRTLARTGGHRLVLPRLTVDPAGAVLQPALPEIAGDLGVLFGSPEHRVRRAIATYQGPKGREVAKIAFGDMGAEILEAEADALKSIHGLTAAAPDLLGIHHGEGVTVLRMPFKSGGSLKPGETDEALVLLESWFRDLPARAFSEFGEWAAMDRALRASREGSRLLRDALLSIRLRPAVRHGDFARWNLLRQPDGSVTAIDWEWGHPEGLPGLDLVHYLLQDERLVKRLPHSQAIGSTMSRLRSAGCSRHLADAGWPEDSLLPIIASLAYKQGSGHQDNRQILDVAIQHWAETRQKA